jgi:HNH endonuclease
MADFVDTQVNKFIDVTPVNVMRAVVLFGRNAASYKFALAKSILEIGAQGTTAASLSDLAIPYSHHVCEHLKIADRQGTSGRSKFLDTCREFNAGTLSHEQLLATTERLGFENVIDAFHIVGSGEVSKRMFTDDRKGKSKGIILTDDLLVLAEGSIEVVLGEIEGRWRLVETAWDIGVALDLIDFDHSLESFVAVRKNERINVTGARPVLNGYQKGHCFYCYRPISIDAKSPALADVDHVFPHTLQRKNTLRNLDGVWNLVLACTECNRGPGGKFDALPADSHLEQLLRRNNFLIASHNPLRETLINQMGTTEAERAAFLREAINITDTARGGASRWQTAPQGTNPFPA